MQTLLHEPRQFQPGATGWTVMDLDDPEFERRWFDGRHEIVNGVLTVTPPACFLAGKALQSMIFEVTSHLGKGAG